MAAEGAADEEDALPYERTGRTGQEIDVADLKGRILLSELIGRTIELRGRDGRWSGLCPFHDDQRPSLAVDDAPGLWHCHACRAGGDAISFVMRAAKCTFLEAAEWLLRDYGGAAAPPRHRERYENAARRRRSFNAAAALEIWRVARPIPDTPAERYLASRGIEGGLPASLRFGRAPTWIDPASGEGRSIRPALLAACQDVDGRITGIHRTFLTEAGAKAPMEQPRLALGQIRGGALRLGPERRDLMLCEGIEDGLSLTRMFVGATVWVALGAGNMPHVRLPPIVRRVIIAGDADGPGVAAADAAVAAFAEQGLEAATILPKSGARDFNEEWVARR